MNPPKAAGGFFHELWLLVAEVIAILSSAPERRIYHVRA